MTIWSLARQSFRHYFRSHLGTVLGAAIATAVLTGALLVGESVRQSLREMALARLGKIDYALTSGDRLFRSKLAEDLQASLTQSSGSSDLVIAALQIPGTASNPDNALRANQVQVNGVESNFFRLSNDSSLPPLSPGSIWINTRLAAQLKLQPGDTLLLRVPRVSNLSRDAPLSPEEDTTVARRLQVERILSDDQFGRFGLAASQIPPLNAFVSLPLLQEMINASNQANLLLVHTPGASSELLVNRLHENFTLEDAQLGLVHQGKPGSIELRSPRVFLERPTLEAATETSPEVQPVFTYFVNELRLADQATPYSMVTGSSHLVPSELRDDEIVLTQWLAEDLGAKPGDHISLRYYIMGLMRDLIEKTNEFRVHSIVPMALPHADPTLMPDFPGMTDAENCRDWDTGFPINTDAIRDKDEAYWDQYRGTPKAFVTLEAATRMWSNRFGILTALRYSAPEDAKLATIRMAEIRNGLQERLSPEAFGLVFRAVRQEALAASAGAQDFGQLFIGFSFFLIASALLLTALLFRFALEQRSLELGTLLALGFRPALVKRMLLLEGLGLASVGAVIGVVGAIAYARAMLFGLSTIWREAVAAASLSYHSTVGTLIGGGLAGVLVAMATLWWSLRHQTRHTAHELLAQGFGTGNRQETRHRKRSRAGLLGTALLLLALILVGWAVTGSGLPGGEQAQTNLFFLAGALVLVGGLLLVSTLIRWLENASSSEAVSLFALGVRGISRRAGRSRATVALLACGAFLIASIGVFRLETPAQAQKKNSGTGGFTLLAETTVPVVQNLNSPSGRAHFALESKNYQNAHFVPMRVLEGEDASCLNLNRAQRPKLLGVAPQHLTSRFTFKKMLRKVSSSEAWLLLDEDFGPNVVPAIGDAASIQWALGKKLGDTLTYLDSQGREFQVKIVGAIANSILQGNLLISETHFVRRFPNQAGYRMFLVDTPSNQVEAIREDLSKSLQETGMEVTTTVDRLAAFNAVQNTYLGTFQMLGGLGLLLGSCGLGIVLLRNVFERRGELALLLAVGFRPSALQRLVLSEHTYLLAAGLILGTFAAGVAVLPSILGSGQPLPYRSLGITLGAVLVCGLVVTVLAASASFRAPLLKALRNE